MSESSKPLQRLSAVVSGRKLKGNKWSVYVTIPMNIARKLGIDRNDLIELEIKKITKEDQTVSAGSS